MKEEMLAAPITYVSDTETETRKCKAVKTTGNTRSPHENSTFNQIPYTLVPATSPSLLLVIQSNDLARTCHVCLLQCMFEAVHKFFKPSFFGCDLYYNNLKLKRVNLGHMG